MTGTPSRQLLLYDAATRWNAPPLWRGPEEVIEAAVDCLVAGVDSPSLRMLAGASPKDSTGEIKALVAATLDELGLPAPGEMPRTKDISEDGQVVTRPARDMVRFEVRGAAPELTGFEVLVYVNGVEMTRLGAGMGMDPFDLLVPDNRLVATTTPRRVGIARCTCGEYGCRSTDVLIVRDGNAVHWDWELEAPLRGGVSFKTDEYDAEVARIGSDRSWERAEDTTARIVLGGADRERLAAWGLRIDWAAKDYADHDRFTVALGLGSLDWSSEEPGYQVFLHVPRRGRSPEDVAREALGLLDEHPTSWSATWHATRRGTAVVPEIAGRGWRQVATGLPVRERQSVWRRVRTRKT